MKSIFFGGGDLPQAHGDIFTSHFKFWTLNGATETGPYPIIRPRGAWAKEDWKYQRVHPTAGLEYRPHGEGLYEAYIVRNTNVKDEQPVLKLFPHLKEYNTGDLFAPHPEKEGLWTFKGRVDDLVHLMCGAINPTYMEHAVENHGAMRDGLMVPVGKYARYRYAEAARMLVELKPDFDFEAKKDRERLLDELWVVIEEANGMYRPEARIERSRNPNE